MAITLKLQHTFNTRVVYQSAEIEEIRKELAKAVAQGSQGIVTLKDPKEKALVQAGIDLAAKAGGMEDEAMILFLTREAFKSGFRDFIRSELKDLNVTKLGPIHTQVVS
ncbi:MULTISPECIES: hypothetical protein [Pseudomonas]|uniref:hypothetical protein n=1 Tax=Pseudomonas TaxID=286 RepID=UPI003822EEDD